MVELCVHIERVDYVSLRTIDTAVCSKDVARVLETYAVRTYCILRSIGVQLTIVEVVVPMCSLLLMIIVLNILDTLLIILCVHIFVHSNRALLLLFASVALTSTALFLIR